MNPINDMRLEDCCIGVLSQINNEIKMGNILSLVLVTLPVFKAFFYPCGAPQLASLSSTTVSITTENWVLLTRSVQATNEIYRKAVYNHASYHVVDHIMDNNSKLQEFWEGIADAFA